MLYVVLFSAHGQCLVPLLVINIINETRKIAFLIFFIKVFAWQIKLLKLITEKTYTKTLILKSKLKLSLLSFLGYVHQETPGFYNNTAKKIYLQVLTAPCWKLLSEPCKLPWC